ncbi:MAG: adenosine deaminase family protein, partial [Oscillospiraceae bacterium]
MQATLTQIEQLPKLELHVHLESTMDGQKLAGYAARCGKTMVRPPETLYQCSADDLSHFLAFLDYICSLVGDTDALSEIAYDFARRSADENILYGETILNPTHWGQFTVPQLIAALTDGFDRAAADGGTDCRFTLSLSRNQSAADAQALVDTMVACRTPRLVGLSIDGNEALTGRTGEKFSPVFARAHAAGFGITVHAGESSGPEGVWDALELLFADRLDHGVRAAEDSALVARLAREEIPLNLCLTSNLTLLYRDPAAHPLSMLHRAGIPLNFSRDDPTFLGLTLTEELSRVAAFADFSLADLVLCQHHAVDAAFCDADQKNALHAALYRFSPPE